ncbi:hypothetical protein CLPU_2c01280 [Gottschalkia purinilytica]|uniref:Uncharacterized protein n=1 Tax=Gottschalkia purinilytica TaxID=1503 RepID=A0A0L0WDX2_GOTPU|nr:hypothetical protein [Gottschalkia purinilytica]KNF09677.1 hypothetical protein CLPU_2c01280 [Gottschalkia purinilytica]
MSIIFTIIVYVFFIYGVIEFGRNIYIDIINGNKPESLSKITVYVHDEEHIDYLLNILRRNFKNIVFVMPNEDDSIESEKESNKTKEKKIEYKILDK